MNKTGETYLGSEFIIENGFIEGTSARPRLICAATYFGNGPLHAIQNQLFPLLKEMFPGFIQAMAPNDIVQIVSSQIDDNWNVFDIDGSSFDSSQFRPLMQADDYLWDKLEPAIKQILDNWIDVLRPYLRLGRDPKALLKSVMTALKNDKFDVFVFFPGFKGPEWDARTKNIFRRDFSQHRNNLKPWEDFVHIHLYGVTVSGHATKTTLGGTLRSLMYAYYYCREAGVTEPWKPNNRKVFVIASGDDVNIFCNPKYTSAIRDSILRNSTRTSDAIKSDPITGLDIPNRAGLGQCIKKVNIGRNFWETTFCSKLSYAPDGTRGSWKLVRDPRKALYDK